MPFWKKESAEEKDNRQLREQEQIASLAALESGRVPLHAEQRLSEQAGNAGFFTSNLTTNEHLLSRHASFEPLGQVMGSSFFKVAYSSYATGMFQSTGELRALTEAQLSSRTLALSRLRQEAEILGAHGVIGVRLVRREHDWSNNVVEFTAIGTAVRLKGAAGQKSAELFTSALSGQEFWKLHEAGYLPVEIAYGVCSYYIHSDMQTNMVLSNSWGSGMTNQELVQYTAGFQTARNIAMTRFSHEVRRVKAQGAVGVKIDWDCEEIEYEVNDNRYVDLLVHFTALGTAIVARPDRVAAGTSTLTFLDLKDRGSFQFPLKE